MYEFARGPLVWIAFAVFVFGTLFQVVRIIRTAKKDKVVYPYMNGVFSIRSIFHWLVPFGSHNMRIRPFFTAVSFLFHFCLLITPLFVMGHLILIKESWSFGWWALPESLTNAMTIFVICGGLFFGLRRIANPTVRLVSTAGDFLLLLLVLSPFFTGLLAYYQAFDYEATITAHIVLGCFWLMAIPFTRLVHMAFFPLTRAYMGSEFGYVRNARDW